MKILHVNKSLFDVFWGDDGWEPHTRIRITRNPDKTISLNHVSGTRLPFKWRATVVRSLNK